MASRYAPDARRRIRLACAAILLAVVGLSILHAATSHCQATGACLACSSAHAPALTQPERGLPRPLPPPGAPIVEPVFASLSQGTPLLKLLRAPPAAVTA